MSNDNTIAALNGLFDMVRVILGQGASPVSAGAAPAPSASPLIGQHVVIRTHSAGVHFGTLVAKEGTNILLKDARRLWKWSGAFTLSEVATNGVTSDGSRISTTVPLIELTQAIEIIPTSETARSTFNGIKESDDE